MNTSTIISLCAVLIAFGGLIISGRKETRNDAADVGRMEAKLDSISGGVEDIRVEFRIMRGRIDSLAERMSVVESSCKQAHKRLDAIQHGKKITE